MTEKQNNLFNKPISEDWEREWLNMPEFINENKKPFKQILINFKSKEDMIIFSNLVNQKITVLTKSINFPIKEDETISKYLYL